MTRAPLLAAVAFAGLLLLGAGCVPTPPGIEESGPDVVAYYREHADAIPVQAWLTMAASVPGAFLVGLVCERLGRSLGVAFAVAAATTVAVLAVGLLVRLALARHPGTITPGTARTLADVEAYWGPLLTFPIVTQAAITTVASRRGHLASWLAPVSAVLAVEQLAETATLFGDSGFLAPGGGMNSTLGPPLYLLWILALGAACARPTPDRT